MQRHRRLALAAGFGLLCVGVTTLVEAAEPYVVTQRGRSFGVKSLAVAVGSVVRILNDDEFTHHAVIKSPDLKFDSGEIERGQHADIVLDKAGYFAVRCAIHPKMRLEITAK